jgi:hypothetical protein
MDTASIQEEAARTLLQTKGLSHLPIALPGRVFEFKCLVFEKRFIWEEPSKIMNSTAFCGK